MLSDDVIEFYWSLGGGMLCTRSAANVPAAHELFISELTPTRLVGLVPEHLARSLRENVADNGDASFVTSRVPGDHRSVQVKGRITELGDAIVRTDEFEPCLEPMTRFFSMMMPADQARVELLKLSRHPAFRVQLDVTHVFDQTPGPKAGQRLSGGDR